MKKKYLCLFLGLVALISMFAMALENKVRFPWASRAVIAVTSPFTNAIAYLTNTAGSLDDKLESTESLQKENERLQRSLDEVRFANLTMADIYAENIRLREMLEYKNNHKNQRLLVAKVVALNMGDLRDAIMINRGTVDGLAPEMAVVTPKGLLGVVEEVYPHNAKVMLLSSNRCTVGARILRAESRAVGVITGRSLTTLPLIMEHLQREADVVAGDIVVTSGYSDRHPAGIVIGTVANTKLDAAGLLKTATVEAAVNSTNIEEIMVVLWERDQGMGGK